MKSDNFPRHTSRNAPLCQSTVIEKHPVLQETLNRGLNTLFFWKSIEFHGHRWSPVRKINIQKRGYKTKTKANFWKLGKNKNLQKRVESAAISSQRYVRSGPRQPFRLHFHLVLNVECGAKPCQKTHLLNTSQAPAGPPPNFPVLGA